MSDGVQTSTSNGARADIDAVETREWLEALDAVVAHDGPQRARDILTRVIERAQAAGTGPIATLNTPYVNTIPPEQEAQIPGAPALDRALERDRDGGAGQQGVLGARRPHRHLPVAGGAHRDRLQPLLAGAERAPRRRPRLLSGPRLTGQLRAGLPRGPAERRAARRLSSGDQPRRASVISTPVADAGLLAVPHRVARD